MKPLFISNKKDKDTIVTNKGSTVTMCVDNIILDQQKNHTLPLVEADVAWCSPNIFSSGPNKNNVFKFSWYNNAIINATYVDFTCNFDDGLYNLDQFQRQLDIFCLDNAGESPLFKLEPNTATSKIYVHFLSNYIKLDVSGTDNVFQILGFNSSSGVLGSVSYYNDFYESDNKAKFNNVTNILINCSIIHGSYLNSIQSNVLSSIIPDVEPYSMILYRPNYFMKVPITTHSISQITFNLTDQEGTNISFLPNTNYTENESWHIRLVIEEEK